MHIRIKWRTSPVWKALAVVRGHDDATLRWAQLTRRVPGRRGDICYVMYIVLWPSLVSDSIR